ncbi:MAG: MBL fold metallo-hydrolase, partial [Planctomycetota bacterium]|nr:MBL fold metallo-hydrolase [Planctomycetota bacterium]
QAAYLIGCQRTGEAIVIDPERDIDRYLNLARSQNLRIVAVAETHIHADFLSGARELAEQTGAEVFVSGEGGEAWTPRWKDMRRGGSSYRMRFLRDGDTFSIGGIDFRAIHTPGHTPEHLCYLVTDRGGGADQPMGVLSGDFIFVGDVGRPDLLESAVGQAGAAAESARDLFHSIERTRAMPEHLQVWPAHGAGSACGKALGAVPQSTIGYENRFNPALRERVESAFIRRILEGQPEPPLYFARMKTLNRDGAPLLGELPAPKREHSVERIGDAQVLDLRPWPQFRDGHVRGAVWAPLTASFATVAGSYLDPERPVALIAEEREIGEAVRRLVRVGIDRVEAWVAT